MIYLLVIRTLVTGAIFCGLPILVVAWIYFEIRAGRRPPQSAFSCFNDSEWELFESVKLSLARIIEQKIRVLRDAKQSQILPKIDGTYRFDGRNPRARTVNNELDRLTQDYERVSEQYRSLEREVYYGKYWPLRERFISYRHYASRRSALRAALVVFLVSGLLIVSIVPAGSWQASIKLQHLLWAQPPIPMAMYAPALAAVGSSIVAMFICGLARYLATEPAPKDSAKFQHEWSKFQPANEFEELGWGDLNSDDDELEDEKDLLLEWYDVLEVSPDATPEDIEKAYEAKVKQYRPSRAGKIEPGAGELFEEQIQELEAAYREATGVSPPRHL
jgi:DnaJ domain